MAATDGSDLAAKIVDHGVALAKEIGTKVTAATVSERVIHPDRWRGPQPRCQSEVPKSNAASGTRIRSAPTAPRR